MIPKFSLYSILLTYNSVFLYHLRTLLSSSSFCDWLLRQHLSLPSSSSCSCILWASRRRRVMRVISHGTSLSCGTSSPSEAPVAVMPGSVQRWSDNKQWRKIFFSCKNHDLQKPRKYFLFTVWEFDGAIILWAPWRPIRSYFGSLLGLGAPSLWYNFKSFEANLRTEVLILLF